MLLNGGRLSLLVHSLRKRTAAMQRFANLTGGSSGAEGEEGILSLRRPSLARKAPGFFIPDAKLGVAVASRKASCFLLQSRRYLILLPCETVGAFNELWRRC